MTQDNNLVSPSTSACPKPGASKAPSLRPSDSGDTDHVARVSQPARQINLDTHTPTLLASASGSAAARVAHTVPRPAEFLAIYGCFGSFPPRSTSAIGLSAMPIAHRPFFLSQRSTLNSAAAALLLPRLTGIFRISTDF